MALNAWKGVGASLLTHKRKIQWVKEPIVNLTPEHKGGKYKHLHEYIDAIRITLDDANVTTANMENARTPPTGENRPKYIQIYR